MHRLADQAAQIETVYEQLDCALSLVQAQVQPLERAWAAIGVLQANLERQRDVLHEAAGELRNVAQSLSEQDDPPAPNGHTSPGGEQ